MINRRPNADINAYRRIAVALAFPQSLARHEITCALPTWSGNLNTPESVRLARLRAGVDLTDLLDEIINEQYDFLTGICTEDTDKVLIEQGHPPLQDQKTFGNAYRSGMLDFPKLSEIYA